MSGDPVVTRNVDGSLSLSWPHGRSDTVTASADVIEQFVVMINALVARVDFDAVSAINRERSKQWHGDAEPWSGADWGNAMQGEAGEAGNVVKKLRRLETNTPGRTSEQDAAELTAMLADEIADTYLYLDLLAEHYGITMYEAIARKFNRTSEAYGFEQRLPL